MGARPARRRARPLGWRAPARVFVDSMGDLFHEDVADAWLDSVWAVMAFCGRHTFQVLTKRPDRMRDYLLRRSRSSAPWEAAARSLGLALRYEDAQTGRSFGLIPWPLPNVVVGTSVEDQERADLRVPALLATPAACRMVSYEPALGPVDWRPWLGARDVVFRAGAVVTGSGEARIVTPTILPERPALGWLVVGGESGPRARPCDVAWLRQAVRQAQAAGVPVFVKQLGAVVEDSGPRDTTWAGPDAKRQDRKGGDPAEWPADLRVREWPTLAGRSS